MKIRKIYIFYFLLLISIIFSGCLSSNGVAYSPSKFTFGILNQSPISKNVTLICIGNITCTQNTSIHTITIDSNASGNASNNYTVYNNYTNINIGSNLTFNATICNPANQASSYNGTGFECVSIIDNENDPIAMANISANIALWSSLGRNGTNGTNGGVNRSVREYHLGDGITFNYSTNFSIISGTSEIYLNGAKQNYNRIYTEGSNSINFTEVTIPDDWIEIKYETTN